MVDQVMQVLVVLQRLLDRNLVGWLLIPSLTLVLLLTKSFGLLFHLI
jgi:hypothetical protein